MNLRVDTMVLVPANLLETEEVRRCRSTNTIEA